MSAVVSFPVSTEKILNNFGLFFFSKFFSDSVGLPDSKSSAYFPHSIL